MKRSLIFITLFFLIITFVGCKKFLNRIPDSQYSLAGAYKTESDFQQAIGGVYAQLQVLYQSNTAHYRAIIARGDDIDPSAGYLEGLPQFTNTSNNTRLSAAWDLYWRIIYLSNLIIDKVDEGSFTNAEMQKYIKGEAFMLRAYSYWSLGWQFGGMPIIDRTMSEKETKQVPRSTQKETFDFASADYSKAIEMLPQQWVGSNLGRATKYAAEGMLARLYMFQSEFSKAEPLLIDIINSNKHKLEEKYLDCFTDSYDNGMERVWEVQFTGGQTGEGQAFATGLLPEAKMVPLVIPFSGFSTAMRVSDNLYLSYEAGDLRRDVSTIKNFVVGGVLDTTTVYITKYSHYDQYTPKTQSDWANNLPILRYTDVLMMYAETLNELGYVANGKAFDILNNVRNRAALNPLTSAELPDQGTFRDALRTERRHEFAFEGLRWMDIIRWSIAKDVMNKFFQSPKNGGGKYLMEDFQKIFAIPFGTMSAYNDESIMPQNPGY